MPSYPISPESVSLWLSLAVIAILEGLSIHTWQYRKEPGALWQVWLQASKGLWLLVLLVGSRSVLIQEKILCLQISTVLAFFVCYLWFRFITELSGYDRRISVPRWRGIRYGAGVFSLLILVCAWRGWLWSSLHITNGVFHSPRSLLGNSMSLPVYALNVFTLWINTRWALRNAGLRRRQAWMFLVPSIFTWSGQIISRMRGLDSIAPCAIGFCLSGLITIWAFHRWRLYSILPLAREVVVEGMVDGLMVIDDEGYIVALNAPTRTIFADSEISIGKTIEDALQAWPEMVCRDNTASVWETLRQQGDAVSYYQVTRTSLRISTGHVLGQVLVFKDITNKKLQQERIVEQERALAMMTERERLGRELHDGQGQVWSYLSLTTQMLRTMLAQEKYEQADQELVRLFEVVQEMHTEFRESIYGLQSSVSAGLIYALDGQLEWYCKYCKLEVKLELRCEWRRGMLTPAGEAHLLRIVQEAMVNIRKSAQASHVRVIFERVDGALQVLIEDNGCGFEVAKTLASVGHHGLGIMRERAKEMGGRLEVESHPGDGTQVRLTVPLAGEGWGDTLQ